MVQGCWFLACSLWCLTGWAAPVWALRERGGTLAEDRDDKGVFYNQGPAEELGRRILMWLVSLAGFYGLMWLMDDFGTELFPPVGQKEVEVTDCNLFPAHHASCLPKRGCSIKSNLKSLGQMEEELVTLLYRLRKHKIAVDTGCPSEDWGRRTEEQQGSFPNNLVIYTIHDET